MLEPPFDGVGRERAFGALLERFAQPPEVACAVAGLIKDTVGAAKDREQGAACGSEVPDEKALARVDREEVGPSPESPPSTYLLPEMSHVAAHVAWLPVSEREEVGEVGQGLV